MANRFWRIITLLLIVAVLCSLSFSAFAKAPTRLVFYQIGNWPQPEQELVFREANKIIQSKINAVVDFKCLGWGNYGELMNVILSAQEPFDLCFTSTWACEYHKSVANGAFMAIDKYLPKYAPTAWNKVIPASVWDATRVRGQIYAVPNRQVWATTLGLCIVKDYAEKYKFDAGKVKELKDIEPYLKALKDGEPGVTPYGVNKWGDWWRVALIQGMESVMGPAHVSSKDNAAKVFNGYETAEFKAYCQLMRDWYLKGYIKKDAHTIVDYGADMRVKRVGVVFGTNKPSEEAEFKDKFGYDIIAKAMREPLLQTNQPLATMLAVSRTSKNPVTAVKFIELLHSDAQLFNLLNYGIQDRHWTKIAGTNRIALKEGSAYNPTQDWAWGDQFLSWLRTDIEVTDKLNKSAKASIIMGFINDITPVKDEMAQIKSVEEEFTPGLFTGAVDPNEVLPKFLDKLEKAGLRKVLAEAQKQSDAWKAANKKK